MIISVYNSKGGTGKTPISTNIALDKEYCLGTNESFIIFDEFMDDDDFMQIATEESFPAEIKAQNIPMVFDLAGSISKFAYSITSAIEISDLIIVPIDVERKSIVSGINTINQLLPFKKRIIVVATKLEKNKGDFFKRDEWHKSQNFILIENAVRDNFGDEIKVLPLKKSKAFDNIFDEGKSIHQMMKENPLAKYNYQEVSKQIETLYNEIGL